MYGGSSVLYDLFQPSQPHLVDMDARRAGKHKQHGIGRLIATKAIAFFVRMQRSRIGRWLRLVGHRPQDNKTDMHTVRRRFPTQAYSHLRTPR